MNSNVGHDLKTVLKLSPKEISLGLAMFYIAYVIFDVPSNLLMTRLSPRIWMARIVFSIGIIGLCFAFIQAAWSLYLLRFLLGVAAAGLWPGMAYYLTLFYPPSRTGKRIGMYFTASQLSAAVIGLVSAGFQKMDGARGLVGFQWMFLLWGRRRNRPRHRTSVVASRAGDHPRASTSSSIWSYEVPPPTKASSQGR